ncbi:oxidoreductase [Actinorhabdospora filicis]|uniref:Oxidoreductase n=1 Tax=Actinorhabdospora filicis TaxID=1785913 RepID=A0A9W6SP77_9ACTN|nr:Gfo/Idh/MocA family oxidoreductase [Actinorhabdospora filicis]GLZ79485.1 oxidoreductase [Actinorhabdospora filicis]
MGASTLRVGMIGYAFMGQAHSAAWREVNPVYADLPVTVEMTALCGRSRDKVEAAARQYGWSRYETDWRAIVAADDIDIVDIGTPGHTHAEIAVAALRAGKHVLCEKPLANSVAEAEAMAKAAAEAPGLTAMCGFTYRRVPAVTFLRHLVQSGRFGRIRHVRAQYLQDWLVDPDAPWTWRLARAKAGSGALGDIGSHIVDLVNYVTEQHVTRVVGTTRTFVAERPLADDDGTGEVDVDDAVSFLADLDGGAMATFEATRMATGRKNALRLEINGLKGSAVFDLERPNELDFHDTDVATVEQGFRRILVTEKSHPYFDVWWPPGHTIGYQQPFTHQAHDFLRSIIDGVPASPSFADGLRVQRVLDAVEKSAASGGWVEVGEEKKRRGRRGRKG